MKMFRYSGEVLFLILCEIVCIAVFYEMITDPHDFLYMATIIAVIALFGAVIIPLYWVFVRFICQAEKEKELLTGYYIVEATELFEKAVVWYNADDRVFEVHGSNKRFSLETSLFNKISLKPIELGNVDLVEKEILLKSVRVE